MGIQIDKIRRVGSKFDFTPSGGFRYAIGRLLPIFTPCTNSISIQPSPNSAMRSMPAAVVGEEARDGLRVLWGIPPVPNNIPEFAF